MFFEESSLKFMGRVLVGLALSVILLGCSALQQVDRGLYQLAEQVSETDRVTGQRTLSFADRSAQIRQGNAVIDQLLAGEEKAGRKLDSALDAKQYERMIGIFDRVLSVSHLRNERWRAALIDRDSFNAFTTGGTWIVIHRGLMEQLADDSEVAAVVAHEIAHTVANHVFEAQSMAKTASLSGSKAARRGSYRAAFTHENEREADRIGILYAALAGYDPLAASRIWERQYAAEGNRRALFAHDHPVNSERAEEARRVGEKVKAYYRSGVVHPDAAKVLRDNPLWQSSSDDQVAAGEGGGVQALGATLVSALVQHEQAKAEELRQARQAAFVRHVQQQLQLVSEQRPAADRWLLRFDYFGQPVLKRLTLGGLIKGDDGKAVATLVGHVAGPIRRGQSFQIELRGDALIPLTDLKRQVQLYLDDALAE